MAASTPPDGPTYDEAELAADEVEYPIQIKGKVRARLTLPASLKTPADIKAVALTTDTVKDLVNGAPIRKAIVVPGKIINFIV